MNRLSRNFTIAEYLVGNPGVELSLEVLCNIVAVNGFMQALRNMCDSPIRITSGYRTDKHNEDVGGKPNSRHLVGLAVDFQIDGRDATECLGLVKALTDCLDARRKRADRLEFGKLVSVTPDYSYIINDKTIHVQFRCV